MCRAIRNKQYIFSKIVKRLFFDDANAVCLPWGRNLIFIYTLDVIQVFKV